MEKLLVLTLATLLSSAALNSIAADAPAPAKTVASRISIFFKSNATLNRLFTNGTLSNLEADMLKPSGSLVKQYSYQTPEGRQGTITLNLNDVTAVDVERFTAVDVK